MKKVDLVQIYNVEFSKLRSKIYDLKPASYNQSIDIASLKSSLDCFEKDFIEIYKNIMFEEDGGLK